MPKKEETAIGEMSYEKAFTELEKVVSSLENDQLTLDESMRLFARGQSLVEQCSKLLDTAELKVQTLTKMGEGEKEE
jgi:exodeoxyribonuclease VII small subunit